MRKILSVVLSFGLLFQQSGLVYAVGELNLANYLSQAHSAIAQPDQFRPPQLRYISYDIKSNDFKLLLDKGGAKLNELSNSLNSSTPKLNNATQELFNYFLIGLALPNDTFWVNLRPDAPENIIDPLLEKTDIGKIFLEADLQLKKDTASLTSPQNPEGKVYWDKLYKKAGELFGTENITIPTITRPWIVPNEVIVRETEDSAYIYKATLKVMLEADYLQNQKTEKQKNRKTEEYGFSDPRLKELNEYSSQIIRETIIPKLTKEINSSKRYAQLRQVYYSLVLSRWFKQKYSSLGSTRASEHQSAGSSANSYLSLIDSGNLANLASQQPCDKQSYFQAYQKSFKDGEYNLKETVATPFGQSIRSYISGGLHMKFGAIGADSPITGFNVSDREDVTEALTGLPLLATIASPLEDYVRRVRVEVTNYHENRIRKGEPNYPYIDIGSVEYCSRDELKSIVLKITELENSEGRISSARAWREHYYKLSEITSSPLTNSDPVSVSPTGSPVTPREILELAKKEINETNREFQYYRVNHYISYYERIDTADPFSKEDVIKKLTNEITALQDVIDKSKQNGSQISDVVSFEALRTKNFFKDLRKKLKNSPNQLDETRNSKVKKSGSPLTPDESVNYVDEALKKLTNFYQWDNEKSSDATLDDLIEAAKKAGESKLKPNAMEVTSEVEEWYGLAEKLAKIKSEWSVYAGSPLTIEQSKELFKEIVKTIQERGPTSRYKKISSMQGREYATFSGLKKLCEEFISYFEAEPGLYSLKKGELGRLKKFSLSLNVSIIAEKFPEKFYQSIATKMALLNSDYLTDIEYDPNGRPSHARFRGAIKIDIEDGQGNVRPFSCDIKVFPDNKIENKYEVMLIQGSDRVSIIVSEHGNKPAPINTNLFYNFHSDEELIPVAQSIVSFFNYPRAVASPLEILTEKFKAKGFSYGSLNAYVKLKEYLKELDAGQPIELDGIVYDSKSIEIINTIDNANNRYAQISVFSEDKSVPYHRIIIRGYQKSGSVFTYLDMGQDYERQDNEKKLPKDREDLKERLEGTAFNDYDNFADVIMTAINKAVSKPTKKASGSLPAKGVSSSLQLKRGGIDLTDRMLKINLERVGSFASSALILPEITNLEALDLDKEFEQIQAMVSSSIRPSDTRILEFAAACYYREEFDQRLAQVSSCIKAAHLADEISGRDSSDALRLATMLPDALYGG